MSKKAFSMLLIVCIACTLSSWYLVVNITYKNEKKLYDDYGYDVALLQYNEGKFDYLNGIWLMPVGLLFVSILLLLDFPSYEDIYKKLKSDLKIKIYEDIYKHGKP
jgi:hypothetical protein